MRRARNVALADLPEVFGAEELARLLAVDPRTVRRGARSGEIPRLPGLGRLIKFSRVRIEEWLRGREAGAVEAA